MPAGPRLTFAVGRRGPVVVISTLILLLGTACSSDAGVAAAQRRVTAAEEAVTEANAALEQAGTAFCAEGREYILAIDRYGKAFNDAAATVGDLETLGADLAEPRESTEAAAQAVLDAHDAVNAANQELVAARVALEEARASASGTPAKTGSPVPTPPTSSPSVPPASVEHVKAAESDLEAAAGGITDQTPISDAAESFTSAAFALEVAWLNLFADAGCLSDRSEEAAAALRSYTVALQKDLKTAGYLQGEVDGVYGPGTVSAVEDLQADAGLPVTGLVDRATMAALQDAVAAQGATSATQETIEAASIQTALKLAGFWPGPIDGEWTPELEAALKDFQSDIGVEPTGAVDAATLAALKDVLIEISSSTSTPTPSATGSASPSES